jgi:hypothetical protein
LYYRLTLNSSPSVTKVLIGRSQLSRFENPATKQTAPDALTMSFSWNPSINSIKIARTSECTVPASTVKYQRWAFLLVEVRCFWVAVLSSYFLWISYREILQNFAKYHEIFVTKLEFSQGKIHFWIFLHYTNTTKKIYFVKSP